MSRRRPPWGAALAAGVAALSVGALAETFDVREPSLAPYRIEGTGIARPLTGRAGDPARGRAIARARTGGHCILCHAMPIPEEPAHGDTGPDLAGGGDRLSGAEIRLRIVNPKYVLAESMMPAYYRIEGLHRVAAGRPLLGAEDVEDLVAYLATLKGR